MEELARGRETAADPAQRQAWLDRQQRKTQFAQLVMQHRDKLRALYAMPLPDNEKRPSKAAAMADLREAYAKLKTQWGGDTGYDSWISQNLNNAQLASVALYTQLMPAFEVLLEQEGRDLPRFYRRVSELARLPATARAAVLGQKAAAPHPAYP